MTSNVEEKDQPRLGLNDELSTNTWRHDTHHAKSGQANNRVLGVPLFVDIRALCSLPDFRFGFPGKRHVTAAFLLSAAPML